MDPNDMKLKELEFKKEDPYLIVQGELHINSKWFIEWELTIDNTFTPAYCGICARICGPTCTVPLSVLSKLPPAWIVIFANTGEKRGRIYSRTVYLSFTGPERYDIVLIDDILPKEVSQRILAQLLAEEMTL